MTRDPRYSDAATGSLPAEDTPESRERAAAWKAAYDAARARGLDDAAARIEGAKADARARRAQLGLEPEPEPSAYDAPGGVPAWRGRRRNGSKGADLKMPRVAE